MGERDDKKGGYWRSCLVEGTATSSNDPCTLYALSGYFIPEAFKPSGSGSATALQHFWTAAIRFLSTIQRRIWT